MGFLRFLKPDERANPIIGAGICQVRFDALAARLVKEAALWQVAFQLVQQRNEFLVA